MVVSDSFGFVLGSETCFLFNECPVLGIGGSPNVQFQVMIVPSDWLFFVAASFICLATDFTVPDSVVPTIGLSAVQLIAVDPFFDIDLVCLIKETEVVWVSLSTEAEAGSSENQR